MLLVSILFTGSILGVHTADGNEAALEGMGSATGDTSTQSNDTIKTIEDDWYIGAEQTVTLTNQTLIIKGNIIINASGKLSFHNITLILENSSTTPIDIIVEPNGSFYMTGSSIETKSNKSSSSIIFRTNSNGKIMNTTMTNIGVGEKDCAAILIQTDNVELENCAIEQSNYGIFLDNCTPRLNDIKITDSNLGIFGINTKCELINYSVNNCALGLKLVGISNVTAIDSVLGIPRLASGSKLLIRNSLIVKTKFETPYIKAISDADVLIVNTGVTIYSTSGFGGSFAKTDNNGEIKPLIIDHRMYSGKDVKNFTTSVSTKYKSRVNLNRAITLNKPLTETVTFPNHLPELMYPSVSPEDGEPNTIFTFKIKYLDLDGDIPDTVHFDMDGKTYNLSLPDDPENLDWKNGTWLQFNKTLTDGEHKFRFKANDGFGFPDIYAPSGKNEYINGPRVARANSPPILSNGSVTPVIGNPDTSFTYRIKYFDPNNDKVGLCKLYIDGIPYTMQSCEASEDEIDNTGCWFEYETQLPEGNHEFWFKFKDNNGSSIVRMPEGDGEGDEAVIAGPCVNSFENKIPIIGNGTVSPDVGHKFILYSYTISYFDPEGDLPSIAIVIIDGVSFNLTRARIVQNIYFYETYMPLGEHFYYFEFWDMEHQHYVRYPSELGVAILGPIVVDMPPKLWDGQVTPMEGEVDTSFRFSIYYEDFENDTPSQAQVMIDNQTFNLSNIATFEQDGKISILFSYSTELGLGEHSYYFMFYSGQYVLRYPDTGYLSGPKVIEKPVNTPAPDLPNPIIPDVTQPIDVVEDDENNTNTNSPDDTEDSNNSKFDSGIINLDEVIHVLNQSSNLKKEPEGYRFDLTIICELPEELMVELKTWVNISGNMYLMTNQKTNEENIVKFIFSKYLEKNENYYHLLFTMGDSEKRYPYGGEYPILGIEDNAPEKNETIQQSKKNFTQDRKFELLQVFFIILIILTVIFFSFYRKYIELRGRR